MSDKQLKSWGTRLRVDIIKIMKGACNDRDISVRDFVASCVEKELKRLGYIGK